MDKDEITSELKLTLEGLDKSEFNYNKASLFQGVLMEHIAPEYAEKLHAEGLKPYSQCVRLEDDKIIWHIYTMSREAYTYIVEPLLDERFKEFELKHNDVIIDIADKEIYTMHIEELFEKFYSTSSNNYFTIYFRTPTAFKKNKKYSFYPDIFNIYQSIMMKFENVSASEGMFNENTLEQLTESTEIIGYNLRKASADTLKNVPSKSYSELFRSVSNMVSEKKAHRYDAATINRLNKTTATQYSRECRVCKRLSDIDEDDMCDVCSSLKNASNQILYERFFVVTREDEGNSLKLPGNVYLIAESEEKLRDRMLQKKDSFMRAYSKNKFYTGLNVATKIWVEIYG